ncbi:MAG: creatininase family protein [Pirellulaceae bacterium]|nr:creatininase family protein [Pirellulaceae bacterium]
MNETQPSSDNPKFLLAEMTLAEVRKANFQVAVLPFGATEPHNLHLPYGTDNFEAECIGREACLRASKNGAKVVLLPNIPYGTEGNLAAFPLAMNLQPSTVMKIVEDLVLTLSKSGIRKLLLLNSHGGNELKPILRELYGKTDVQLFLCNWFLMVRDAAATIFDVSDDHAGEMETSLILAYRPELVAINANQTLKADLGETRPFRFQALQKGWVGVTRPWHLLTTNSGSGNPHAATAEKGERLMEVICERLAPFLVQLSNEPIDESFPFE